MLAAAAARVLLTRRARRTLQPGLNERAARRAARRKAWAAVKLARAASATAVGVCLLRAQHQRLDGEPPSHVLLHDDVSQLLCSAAEQQRAAARAATAGDATAAGDAAARYGLGAARALRAHVALRSRFAEDRLREAVERRGVRRCVILGAGLDTFALRQPAWCAELAGFEVIEVDHPASQADKLARIAAAGLAVPANVHFFGIDLGAGAHALETLASVLRGECAGAGAGMCASEAGVSEASGGLGGERAVKSEAEGVLSPVFVSWLGVMMYLEPAASDAVLRLVARQPRGSEIVFSFAPPSDMPSQAELSAAAAGEPWLCRHEPEALDESLRRMCFARVELLGLDEARERYFGEGGGCCALRDAVKRVSLGAAVV